MFLTGDAMVRSHTAAETTPSAAARIVHAVARKSHSSQPTLSRRGADRHPLNMRIPLSLDPPAAGVFRGAIAAWGVDISTGGCALLCERSISPGTYIYADFSEAGNEPCILPICVISCIPLFGSTHRISATFGH
jgi:hypothetical protein